MSNLGLAILYDILNAQPGVLAERVYAPWVDMEQAMRAARLPLFSLESRRPLAEFDVIGFSLPYEQLYTNLLNMLDLAGLPLLAAERDERHPLVIAGGAAAYNPEPLADFVDAFAVGEGEELVLELTAALREGKRRGWSRESAVAAPGRRSRASTCPASTRWPITPTGTVAEVRPTVPEARLPVRKRIVATLPPPVTRPLVPYIDTVHNRAAIEIQRGCGRGCRFCQAGMVYRPVRERPVDEVLAAVEAIVANTGFEEVALLSLSSSDYTQIEALVRELAARHGRQHLSISLPSLRIESVSVELMEQLQATGRRSQLYLCPGGGHRAAAGRHQQADRRRRSAGRGRGGLQPGVEDDQALLHDRPSDPDPGRRGGHRRPGAAGAGGRRAGHRPQGPGERRGVDAGAQAAHALPVAAAGRRGRHPGAAGGVCRTTCAGRG